MADPTTATEPEAAEPTPAATKRKLPVVVFIAAGLIGGVACGLFVAGPLLAKRVGRPAADSAAATGAQPATKEGGQPGAPDAAGPVHLIDNLVLNPAGSGGMRFLLATVGVQMAGAASNEAMKLREVEARDVVLGVLGTKRVEELADIKNREAFKSEIKAALESLFGAGSVKGVYFSQFVVQ